MRCNLTSPATSPELTSVGQGYSDQKRMLRPTSNTFSSTDKWSQAATVASSSRSESATPVTGQSAKLVSTAKWSTAGTLATTASSSQHHRRQASRGPARAEPKPSDPSASHDAPDQKTPEHTPEPPAKKDPRESKLSDYKEGRVIGEGSFAKVSQVTLKATKKTYVWKALNYGNMSDKEKQMLVDEVNILRELDHPNIVKYYDRIIVHKERKIYIVQEFCDAGDLSQLIKKQRQKSEHGRRKFFEEGFIWSVLSEVASALHACHCRPRYGKILHRDLKPGNIFLSKVGSSKFLTVKLGDFGLARILTKDIFAETCVGTPYYMSPELIKKGRYDEKSDIWALGCIVYEMATLYPPFRARGYNELAQKIKQGIFKSLPQDENGYVYSKEMWEILRTMLHINPEKRCSIDDIRRHPCVKLAGSLSQTRQQGTERRKKHSAALKTREQDLSQREKELAELEKALKLREAEINGRRDSLNVKEKAIASKEKEVATKMQMLSQHRRSTSLDSGARSRSLDNLCGMEMVSLRRGRTMSPMPKSTTSSRDKLNCSSHGSSGGKSLGSNSNSQKSSNDSSQMPASPANTSQGSSWHGGRARSTNSRQNSMDSQDLREYNGGANSNHTTGSSGERSGGGDPVGFDSFLQPSAPMMGAYNPPFNPQWASTGLYRTPGAPLPVVGEDMGGSTDPMMYDYGAAQPPWSSFSAGPSLRRANSHPMHRSMEYSVDRRQEPFQRGRPRRRNPVMRAPAPHQSHGPQGPHPAMVPEAPPAPIPQPGMIKRSASHPHALPSKSDPGRFRDYKQAMSKQPYDFNHNWDEEVKKVSRQMEESVRLPNAFLYGRQEGAPPMTDTSTTFESLMTKQSFRGQRT